jgi:hypothetical protein
MPYSERLATIESVTLTHKRLVEKTIEAYLDWRQACESVNDAYRAWSSATGAAAGVAFRCYALTLDREECTAEVYAGLVRRVGNGAAHAVTEPVSEWTAP